MTDPYDDEKQLKAVKALLHPEIVENLPAVKSWMVHAEATRRIVHEDYGDLITTIQENVRVH